MYIFPVKHIKITQGYHQGYSLDFGTTKSIGTNPLVYATNDGYIWKIEKQKKGGNVVYIKHNDGLISEYAHLMDNSIMYQVGDYVNQNMPIAKMGATGVVTGTHLHYSLYKDNIKNNNKIKLLDTLLVTNDVTIDSSTNKKYHLFKLNQNYYVDNVDEEGLIVRDGNRGKTGKLLTIGTKINILDMMNGYIMINENEWVYNNYVSEKYPQLYMVYNANGGLNVRNKASLNSKIINVIPDGTLVKVYKKENKFSKVSNEEKRYVYSSYIKKV